ncbi:MAG: AMP-binding protein, partial [bacterium]|nr:AMP-binding protein [bacterium]
RNYPAGEKTYEAFLQEVIAGSVKAFENQDVQFEELVDRLEVKRDPSRNPLFDIDMVVQNFRQVKPGDSASSRTNPSLNFTQVPQTDRVDMAGLTEQLPLAEKNHPAIKYDFPTAKFDMTFFVQEEGKDVHISIEYYTGIFKLETITRLVSHFKNVVKAVIKDPAVKLKDIEFISEFEKNRLLFEWNDTVKLYPSHKTLHQLFEEQAIKIPDSIALIGNVIVGTKHRFIASESRNGFQHITYKQLDKMSDQIAHYLHDKKNTRPDDRVAILMDRSINLIVAILGILKSGGAYVSIDPSLPAHRTKYIITDAAAGAKKSEKKYIKDLNRLQWECEVLHSYLCLDSYDIAGEKEFDRNLSMDEELWNHVGTSGNDEISSSGWNSSYTGEPLSPEEMAEYGDNILKKLGPLLHRQMRVLEIGCASGVTMYRLAPLVGLYYGTDLSPVIIAKNKERVKTGGHGNIKLSTLAAHEIDKLEE